MSESTKTTTAKAEEKRPAKSEITISGLKAPKGVEILPKKTCVIIKSDTRKLALKGRLLELTHTDKNIDGRVEEIPADVIRKNHLGAMRGFLKGIQDTVDLQKVIDVYFSAKSTTAKKPKTTKKAKSTSAAQTANN